VKSPLIIIGTNMANSLKRITGQTAPTPFSRKCRRKFIRCYLLSV